MKLPAYILLIGCLFSLPAIAQYNEQDTYAETAVRSQIDPLKMEPMIRTQESQQMYTDMSKMICIQAFAEQGNLKKVKYWINDFKTESGKHGGIAYAAEAFLKKKNYKALEALLLPYIQLNPNTEDTIRTDIFYPEYFKFTTTILYDYAAVLYHKGDYTNGLKYFKKALEADRNKKHYGSLQEELHILLLIKTGTNDYVLERTRRLLYNGTERSEEFQTAAKQLFTTTYKDPNYYQQYIDSVKAAFREACMRAVANGKGGDWLSGFSYKDVKGNDFSLKSLHGKIVIVYFWSLPDINYKRYPFSVLQKAKDHYAKDNDVVFLCIHHNQKTASAIQEAEQYLNSIACNLDLYICGNPTDKTVERYQPSRNGELYALNRKGVVIYHTENLYDEYGIERLKAIVDASKIKSGTK